MKTLDDLIQEFAGAPQLAQYPDVVAALSEMTEHLLNVSNFGEAALRDGNLTAAQRLSLLDTHTRCLRYASALIAVGAVLCTITSALQDVSARRRPSDFGVFVLQAFGLTPESCPSCGGVHATGEDHTKQADPRERLNVRWNMN